jgi:hypothetical protein
MTSLRVSDNRRYLQYEDGVPFFYLGDTAWELFHRLTREEAGFYLSDRAAKGFTAIQAVVLAEMKGLTVPNPYGDLPISGSDPAQPNEKYFQHVDYIVEKAESLGVFIGMLPTWGDKWNLRWGEEQEIFTPENARTFGRFLGTRYKERGIIWIMGGDRPVETDAHLQIIRAMAEGIREGDGGSHLMTFHPSGYHSSSEYVHGEAWLDFNMIQSGHHTRYAPNWRFVGNDYGLDPVKPSMDAEPCYENHCINFVDGNGYFDDHDVRLTGYWAVLAGACGHTYGCQEIWQFYDTGRECKYPPRNDSWREVLDLPGAFDVRHIKNLVLSRPYFERFPDNSVVLRGSADSVSHIQAGRDGTPEWRDATYLMAYQPLLSKGATYDTGVIAGKTIDVWLFDPREGTARFIERTENTGTYTAPCPDSGPDWVIVIDDASKGYPAPGSRPYSAGEA